MIRFVVGLLITLVLVFFEVRSYRTSVDSLSKVLQSWSQTYEIPSPVLIKRKNRTSEAYYNASTETILLLADDNSVYDRSFLLSMMAHEFGHHYLAHKHPDISPELQEPLADLMAQELMGESFKETLLQKNPLTDSSHGSIEYRLKFLKTYESKKVEEVIKELVIEL